MDTFSLTPQFSYQLLRSHRRTLGLEITEEGNLIVRAPHRASLFEIENLLQEKQRWILRHKETIKKKSDLRQPRQFIAGEKFLYLGENYCLTIESSNKNKLYFAQGFFLSETALPKARQIFARWYAEQAYHYIAQRTAHYATIHRLQYQSLRITNPKHRWGSCSVDNKLNFSWRLILAPPPVIDYVVAHELAHTVHKNHKKRFWQKVEKIMPDYKTQRRWLKDHGHTLTF